MASFAVKVEGRVGRGRVGERYACRQSQASQQRMEGVREGLRAVRSSIFVREVFLPFFCLGKEQVWPEFCAGIVLGAREEVWRDQALQGRALA